MKDVIICYVIMCSVIAILVACCQDDARCDAAKHPTHITAPGIDCIGTVKMYNTGHYREWTIKCQDGRTYFNASNFTVGN